MAATATRLVSDGRGRAVPAHSLSHLAAGTMVSCDFERAQRLYEDFFGLECVRYAADRMLLRDRRAKRLMRCGERDFFVIDVLKVDAVEHPQRNLNHWGFSVASPPEVERIHAIAVAEAERYWLKKVGPITPLHGSYGFYLVDRDDNWWEVEYRNGKTNDGFFSGGDFDAPTIQAGAKIDPPLPIAETPSRVLGPEAFLTHGTTEVVDVALSRCFYEDVLALRSVRHAKIAQFTAGAGDFAFVGVRVGDRVARQDPINRWIVLVDGEPALKAIRQRAIESQAHFGTKSVGEIRQLEPGVWSFLLCSPDHNWFEVSTRPGSTFARLFDHIDASLANLRDNAVADDESYEGCFHVAR